ncbi:kinase-like domain-containing protein, partial [Amanita rubescens]
REAIAWRSLTHRFILPLWGIFEEKSQLYLVSPLMTNGTLNHWQQKQKRDMLEVAEGVRHLHSGGIVHGDLHGRNILLDPQFHCKITDFGSTQHHEVTVTRSTAALSIDFSAPELFGACTLCGVSDNKDCHGDQDERTIRKTQETDVYAFGCLYYAVSF